VQLDGYIIRIYHDARTSECQIKSMKKAFTDLLIPNKERGE